MERVMYTDLMVDIETTGTHIDNNAMIQLAAVPFNLETREVSSEVFNRCLAIAPNRYMEEECRTNFWGKIPHVYKSIVERMEKPEIVMADFVNTYRGKGLRFWGKPTHFDFAFVESYCRQFGHKNPFDFRTARDLNSYISGLSGHPDPVDVSHIEFEGVEHDAIWDAFYQIQILFDAQDKHIKAELV